MAHLDFIHPFVSRRAWDLRKGDMIAFQWLGTFKPYRVEKIWRQHGKVTIEIGYPAEARLVFGRDEFVVIAAEAQPAPTPFGPAK
jgi:hypothetical protein